jgi:hypothetical protein
LSHCKKVGVKRLWIASNDDDYVTKFYGRAFLNPFLHRDLIQACGDVVEVRCFDNVMGAIKDFGKNAGVKAEKLPTEETSKKIEEDLRALSPAGWLPRGNWEDVTQAVIRAHWAKEAVVGSGYYDFLSRPPLPLLAASSKPEKDEGEQ